ncbi:hypothetical protein HKCCD6035_02315 [Rhodobacterales bacterium HKCCD6035]|nr:hypothetical protein [Rhodobacterales bacterium HKCCD6035]
MKKIGHINATYIRNRVKLILDNKLRPHDPWLTRSSINVLESILRHTDVAVEFGSGRSTKWIAQRVQRLISIETDRNWFVHVADECAAHIDQGTLEILHIEEEQAQNEFIMSIQDETVDLCLVDGHWRDTCALNMLPKIKKGGVIVVDNINLYIPCAFSVSPFTRRPDDGCASHVWSEFLDHVSEYRCIWTSNGVTDTAIWFKF